MGVVVVEEKLHVIEVRLPYADMLIFETDKSLAAMDKRLSKVDDKQIFEVVKIILDLCEQCWQFEGKTPEFALDNENVRNLDIDCVLEVCKLHIMNQKFPNNFHEVTLAKIER